MEDLTIRTFLDDTFTKADLIVELKATAAGKVRFTLSREGKEEATLEDALESGKAYVMKMENPLLWSAEEPNLYDLLIEVMDTEGKITEVIPQRVGFRRFEMKDSIMTLNGKRIVFKGVNRHEFSSRTGRNVSREELIKDLTTMKRNNINAIRTCHYPDAVGIYELCDEFGIYMIAENNMETHGRWDTVGRAKTTPAWFRTTNRNGKACLWTASIPLISGIRTIRLS